MISIGKLDVESMRKQKLIQYVRNHENNKDKVGFISTYVKHNTKEKQHNKFRGTLEDEEFEQLIKTVQYCKIEENDTQFKTYKEYTDLPAILVMGGVVSIEMKKPGQTETENMISIGKGQLVIIDDEYILENSLSFEECSKTEEFLIKTKGKSCCEYLFFDRKIWNDFKKQSEGGENELKLEVLKKGFPLIKNADSRKAVQYAKYFKQQTQNSGDVLTTTTSGSQDLYVVQSGKILIFMESKKVNKNYDKKFVILQIIEKNAIFNEIHCLFDNKESAYGTLVLEDDSSFLHIDKHNIQFVTDNDSIGSFRGIYQGKDRLQKAIIKKLSKLTKEELVEQQEAICKSKNISFKKIEQQINKSTDGSHKIVTHSHIKEREKNLKAFESKMKNTEALDLKKQNGVLMTPRIVSKDGKFKGLDAQAQLSLLALRSMGLTNRQCKQQSADNQVSTEILEQERINLQNRATEGKDLLVHKALKKKSEDLNNVNKNIEKNQAKNSSSDDKNSNNDNNKTRELPNQPVSEFRSLKKRLSITESEALQKIGVQKKEDIGGKLQSLEEEKNKKTSLGIGETGININKSLLGNNNNSNYQGQGEPLIKFNKPNNARLLNFEKSININEQQQQKQEIKKDDKFASQRKRLLKFGI